MLVRGGAMRCHHELGPGASSPMRWSRYSGCMRYRPLLVALRARGLNPRCPSPTGGVRARMRTSRSKQERMIGAGGGRRRARGGCEGARRRGRDGDRATRAPRDLASRSLRHRRRARAAVEARPAGDRGGSDRGGRARASAAPEACARERGGRGVPARIGVAVQPSGEAWSLQLARRTDPEGHLRARMLAKRRSRYGAPLEAGDEALYGSLPVVILACAPVPERAIAGETSWQGAAARGSFCGVRWRARARRVQGIRRGVVVASAAPRAGTTGGCVEPRSR